MKNQVTQLYKLVKSFCKSWNIHDEEVVQSLVWIIYQKLDKFDNTKGKFSTFVYFNCRNHYLLSQREKVDYLKDDELDSIIDDKKGILDSLVLDEKVKQLTAIYNSCSPILKDWLEGMKQKDIAVKYQISRIWCNQLIKKEMSKLKEAYGE